MATVQDLTRFMKGFLNYRVNDIEHCLSRTAASYHLSPDETSKALMNIVHAETDRCLHYSKDKTLFDYQQDVVERFYSERGIIASFATGTGKTLTAVASAACAHNLAKRFGKECNVLVVTPASLVDNMKEEFQKYNYNFGKDLTVVSSNIFRDILLYRKMLADGGYTETKWMKTNEKRAAKFACNKNTFLIVDEAHEFKTDYLYAFQEKNPRDPEPGNVESRAKMFVEECYPHVWKILLLTATPMLNKWLDIMNLIAAVKGVHPKSQVGKIDISRATLSVKGTSFGEVVGTDKIEYDKITIPDQYAQYFRGVVSFKEVDSANPNFPKRNPERYVAAYMSTEYFRKVEEFIAQISKKRGFKKKTDAQMQKELQALQKKIAYLPGNPKVEIVSKLISEGGYDKILIYSRFLNPLRGLKDSLTAIIPSSYEMFVITGKDVPPAKRQSYLKRVNASNKAIVFISDAGGIGLDFKGLEAVIIYEPGINISREEQAIGRSVRYKSHVNLPPGKQRVDIYKLIMRFPANIERFAKPPAIRRRGATPAKARRLDKTPDQDIAIRAQGKQLASQSFRDELVRVNLQKSI